MVVLSAFMGNSTWGHDMNACLSARQAAENERREGRINGPHRTRPTWINGTQVEVDEGIAPVVEWLNSLPDVFTLFSCEGDYANGYRKPYVLFRTDAATLMDILGLFQDFAGDHGIGPFLRVTTHMISVVVDLHEGDLRYRADWYDKLSLEDYVGWMGKSQKVREPE